MADADNPSSPDGASMAEVARFWLAAGADVLMQEEPVNRLSPVAEPAARAKAVAAPAAPAIAPMQPKVATAAAPPPLQAIAECTTLDELRSLLNAWDGCGLKKTATQAVFSDGTPGARLMIIGEAPGREEDQQGKPFVGRSGQLLDRLLKSIGLDRGSAYIANVIYWRPPGNRPPTTEEILQCRPFLMRQIELAKPEILLLAGGVSAKAMLGGDQGILQLRGNWARLDAGQAAMLPAMPTVHPAYLLRNPAHKRLAWSDWLAVRQRLG
jgi:uracil-DNA glycosylase